jgi:hypothetical protein
MPSAITINAKGMCEQALKVKVDMMKHPEMWPKEEGTDG